MGQKFNKFCAKVNKLAAQSGSENWENVAKTNNKIRIKLEALHPFLALITYETNLKETAGKFVEFEFDDDGLKRTNTPTNARVPATTGSANTNDYTLVRGELDLLLNWEQIDHWEEVFDNQEEFDKKILAALAKKFAKSIVKVGFQGTSRGSESIADITTFDKGWKQRLKDAHPEYVMEETPSGVEAGFVVIQGGGADFDFDSVDTLVIETVESMNLDDDEELVVLMSRDIYARRKAAIWNKIQNEPENKQTEIENNTLSTCGGYPVVPPNTTRSMLAGEIWLIKLKDLPIYQHRKVRKTVKDDESNNGRVYFNTWQLDWPLKKPEEKRIICNIKFAGKVVV